MGKLTIDGTLDLAQFWPEGESDADTAKVVINVEPGAVRYQASGQSPQPTTAYEGAFVKVYGSPKVVIKNDKLTVRLQGIDAPELHLQPQSMKGTKYKSQDLGSLRGTGLVKKYRQDQGETATVRLAQYLGTLGPSPVPCQFVTELVDDEGPGDAIDKYGRFVGNVRINNVDINLEILRRGWAVVALYNSMRRGEIEECLNGWNMGRNTPSGIVKYLTKTIAAFEPDLLYRGAADTEVQQEGTRRFIHPKLYRRQCTWWAYRKHGTFKSGFDTFLGLSEHDVFYELDDYLDDAPLVAVQVPIEKMVKNGSEVVYRPDEVVFKDAPSKLYGPDGEQLEQW